MNTIRVFLFLFIIFSVFIVSHFLEYSRTGDVLTETDSNPPLHTDVHMLIPPQSHVTTLPDGSVQFISPRSFSDVMSWYEENIEQSGSVSARVKESRSKTFYYTSPDGTVFIIKLDQNSSDAQTKGTIKRETS